MNSADYLAFEECLKSIDIGPVLSTWLCSNMKRYGVRKPKIDTEINAIPEDFLDCLIEGTVEVGRFRPTIDEVNAAADKYPLKTYIDMAMAIRYICSHGPEVGDDVARICPGGASRLTHQVWDSLCKLQPDSYNDQFFVRCFLNRRLLPEEHENASGIVGKIADFCRIFVRLNDCGAERALRRQGHQFHQAEGFIGYVPEPGDVLKFRKKASLDRFTMFVIVTDTENGRIAQAEFKPEWNSPLKATHGGLELFFLRDPETRLEGYWRRPAS